MSNNSFYVLVGVPGSGKTTFIRNHLKENDIKIISRDAIIEAIVGACAFHVTYNDVFSNATDLIDSVFQRDIDASINYVNDVAVWTKNHYGENGGVALVWDQTNLTKKKRAYVLSKAPKGFKKIAVVFTGNMEVIGPRLLNRPGKTIPPKVLERMIGSFQPVDYTEGFDVIWTVDNFSNLLSSVNVPNVYSTED